MPRKTRSQTTNESKQDVFLNWVLFERGDIRVQTINVPYPLFVQKGSSQKLFAESLQEKLRFRADVNTIQLWMPNPSLAVGTVRRRIKEMVNNGFELESFAEEIVLALPLSTILEGKEKNVNIVHIIITAERLISLNWCFFSSEFSIIETRIAEITRDLFNSPLQQCRELFSDLLRSEFGFRADPRTIRFLMPKDLFPITRMRERKDQLLNNGLQDFVEEVQLTLPLSTILQGKEKDTSIVHIVITAQRLISLNWCFFSSEFSIIESHIAEITRDLFNSPSEQCRELFSDLLQSEFEFHTDPRTIRFLMPKDLFPITGMGERKDQLLNNGLQDFVEEVQFTLPLSTILQGKEKDASILHFFVCVQSPNERHEDHDELADLPESERFKRSVAAMSKRKAPSVGAELIHYRESQKSIATRIYDGHYPPGSPYSTIAPPLELYHRIFNRFLSLIEDCSPTDDDLIAAQELMKYLGELSSVDEDVRNEKINGYLSGILRRNIQPSQNPDKTIPDGVISILVGKASVPLLIAEFKKSLGEGNCDPCIQASLSMQRRWKTNNLEDILLKCCCPTFLLAGGGPWLGILGAVWTDRVIVQPLIELRSFGISSTEEDKQIWKNAQILFALRQALQELQRFYLEDLANIPLHTNGPHPRLYPYPTSYTDNNERVEFKYSQYLDKEAYVPCVTFLAEVISAEVAEGEQKKVSVGEEIVVKYVSRYGKEAHEFLAGKGHAPELLYYGRLPDSPNFASREGSKEFGPCFQRNEMFIVVMRYIRAKPSFKLSVDCRKQLRGILLDLHSEGYVFGDLRNQNILVDNPSGLVKLIDFNWCGEYDARKESNLNDVPEDVQTEVKRRRQFRVGPYTHYPLSISMGSIQWANGVGPLKPILPGHDWFMLERLS